MKPAVERLTLHEALDAGDVISTGTMPGCCGLEHDRWIKPGQTVELEIDGIGTLTNRVTADVTATTVAPLENQPKK